MNNLLKRYRFSKELKRLAKENTAQGKPLCIMDDLVFKTMLSSNTEDSREALRSLLSACTHREISAVQVTNNELIPVHLDAKASRLDVHVTFNDGEVADLEMQIDKSADDLRARAVFYTAMLLSTQSRKGHSYGEIKRVYQIFFLNCTLFHHSNKLPRRYFYMEEKEHDRLTEATEIIFYEMPKLEQKVRDIQTGKLDINSLPEDEKWCIYFRYRHEKQTAELIKKLYRKEEGIMRAEKAVAGIDRDYLKAIRKMGEIKNSMDRAQERYEARREGRAEGLQEGLQQGVQQGLQEKSLEIARKMKEAGRPLSEITEFTGLTTEAINEL